MGTCYSSFTDEESEAPGRDKRRSLEDTQEATGLKDEGGDLPLGLMGRTVVSVCPLLPVLIGRWKALTNPAF